MEEKKYHIASSKYVQQRITMKIWKNKFVNQGKILGQFWVVTGSTSFSSQKYVNQSEHLMVKEMMKDASEYLSTKHFTDKSLPIKMIKFWEEKCS